MDLVGWSLKRDSSHGLGGTVPSWSGDKFEKLAVSLAYLFLSQQPADLVQDRTRSCTQPIGLWTWWKPLMHPLPACMATSLSLTPLAMIIASAAWLHWLHRFCLHENYSATASIMLQAVYNSMKTLFGSWEDHCHERTSWRCTAASQHILVPKEEWAKCHPSSNFLVSILFQFSCDGMPRWIYRWKTAVGLAIDGDGRHSA